MPFWLRATSADSVRRNQAARLATGAVIISLDDDSEFTARHDRRRPTISATSDRLARIAFVNVRTSTKYPPPWPRSNMITDVSPPRLPRCAPLFAVGGYRVLVHQGEERDFCLRLLAAGKYVRLGHSKPIHHHESPRRDWARIDHLGRRNDVLFAYQNVPLPELCWHLPGTIANGLWFGFRVGRPWNAARGLWQGIRDSYCFCHERRPVPRAVYSLHRRLRRQPIRLEEIAPLCAPELTPTPTR